MGHRLGVKKHGTSSPVCEFQSEKCLTNKQPRVSKLWFPNRGSRWGEKRGWKDIVLTGIRLRFRGAAWICSPDQTEKLNHHLETAAYRHSEQDPTVSQWRSFPWCSTTAVASYPWFHVHLLPKIPGFATVVAIVNWPSSGKGYAATWLGATGLRDSERVLRFVSQVSERVSERTHRQLWEGNW